MVRDKIGSTKTKAQLQDWLQNWLIHYVDGSPDTSSDEYKASHPLADGKVELEENEENPGLLQRQVLPQAALPARRPDGLAAPRLADAEVARQLDATQQQGA